MVTNTVRDKDYQHVLAATDMEATTAYSLHTTGYAVRHRPHLPQPRAGARLQFVLDRLTARGLIAWVREPGAIHVAAA